MLSTRKQTSRVLNSISRSFSNVMNESFERSENTLYSFVDNEE